MMLLLYQIFPIILPGRHHHHHSKLSPVFWKIHRELLVPHSKDGARLGLLRRRLSPVESSPAQLSYLQLQYGKGKFS